MLIDAFVGVSFLALLIGVGWFRAKSRERARREAAKISEAITHVTIRDLLDIPYGRSKTVTLRIDGQDVQYTAKM